MFGFFKKNNKDDESNELTNNYMQDFNCDINIVKYKACLASWLTYDKSLCHKHIDEYQYCMVSLNTDLDDFK